MTDKKLYFNSRQNPITARLINETTDIVKGINSIQCGLLTSSVSKMVWASWGLVGGADPTCYIASNKFVRETSMYGYPHGLINFYHYQFGHPNPPEVERNPPYIINGGTWYLFLESHYYASSTYDTCGTDSVNSDDILVEDEGTYTTDTDYDVSIENYVGGFSIGMAGVDAGYKLIMTDFTIKELDRMPKGTVINEATIDIRCQDLKYTNLYGDLGIGGLPEHFTEETENISVSIMLFAKDSNDEVCYINQGASIIANSNEWVTVDITNLVKIMKSMIDSGANVTNFYIIPCVGSEDTPNVLWNMSTSLDSLKGFRDKHISYTDNFIYDPAHPGDKSYGYLSITVGMCKKLEYSSFETRNLWIIDFQLPDLTNDTLSYGSMPALIEN